MVRLLASLALIFQPIREYQKRRSLARAKDLILAFTPTRRPAVKFITFAGAAVTNRSYAALALSLIKLFWPAIIGTRLIVANRRNFIQLTRN